jgi:nitroimidazol reductase NimA-like FMN-containing flavoprotein (pyridoxamine 5'-phosphate oxidase superfamily)
MTDYEPTERTRLRLYKDFGSYDRQKIYDIIDTAPFCQISAVVDDAPYIQATRHWRVGNNVYMHGAVKNKLINALRKGAEACLCFSHFDGYVLTRSAFTHAVLYRSVVAFCRGRFVEDMDEKLRFLRDSIESVQPGRWSQIRPPTLDELKMTGVIELPLVEVSGKMLSLDVTPLILPGGEMEVEADRAMTAWTGVIPYSLVKGAQITSEEVIRSLDKSGS